MLFLLALFVSPCLSIVQFFSPEDLKYTFGVDSLSEVPHYKQVYPKIIYDSNGRLERLLVDINGQAIDLDFMSVTNELMADKVTIVHRDHEDGGGTLEYIEQNIDDCHFHHISNETYAAVSTCDGLVKGTIIRPYGIYVLHPIPDHHIGRVKRSDDGMGMHIIYKREAPADDFCGIENEITSEELIEDEAGIFEDVFVVGQQLEQQSQLVVELALFADAELWRHFNSKYGADAWYKLQTYALTMLNNIQIMYKQPSVVPKLTFKIVRYEVFKAQPSAIAPHLHSYGNAQLYLDRFCRYQANLGVKDWDHAFLLTGHDIHRGGGSNSISGIARLDGMCDPWNTCTLAEGLDFTSAFIGTHELGHSVGMRHDEPYCTSTYIMSASLGPGKVTWSTCSLRDYHSFLQRLDRRTKNCLRSSYLRERLPLINRLLPGQTYDANTQCQLMHGFGYRQITPRRDHYDGICYMMWCGQGGQFGRIVTSHPALEGTYCGPSKWCQLGRCVPTSYYAPPVTNAPATTRPPQPPPVWRSWPTTTTTQRPVYTTRPYYNTAVSPPKQKDPWANFIKRGNRYYPKKPQSKFEPFRRRVMRRRLRRLL